MSAQPTEDVLNEPITTLILSTKSNTTRLRSMCRDFRRHGSGGHHPHVPIRYIGELVQYDWRMFLSQRNFGRVCLLSLENALAEKGLRLDMKLENWKPPLSPA